MVEETHHHSGSILRGSLWVRRSQAIGTGVQCTWVRQRQGVEYPLLDHFIVFKILNVKLSCNVLNLISTVFFLPSILATNCESEFASILVLSRGSPYDLAAVLFALRIYAICGRSKLILCLACTLIFSRFAVDIWVSSLEVHSS